MVKSVYSWYVVSLVEFMNVPMIVNFSKDTHDTNVTPPKIYETAWRERTA